MDDEDVLKVVVRSVALLASALTQDPEPQGGAIVVARAEQYEAWVMREIEPTA